MRIVEDGIVLTIRLTPKSGSNAVSGMGRDEAGNPLLLARVTAAPADNAANRALLALLSSWLDVPKRSLSIVKGQKSRLKLVRIDGNPVSLRACLRRHIDRLGGGKNGTGMGDV